ncbi:MAG TPA: DUF434 domain-containing protein [Thermoanaerobaculia bacterium]|nr:DUF434 domain-containing protein [Thermoanaerobaculia bacterium]
MPDSRSNRGPHPKDERCFAPSELERLRPAVAELSWLLGRGYPAKATLALVGDRHALVDRQRKAVQRCAASPEDVERRRAHRVEPSALTGEQVEIDGYNVLLTVECALSGGLVLEARDGTFRDIAAMSRHYKRVGTTLPALELIGDQLAGAGVAGVHWLFDRPISNSGRLARILDQVAGVRGWPWQVELVANPDPVLRDSRDVVATADSAILDRCSRWLNLARWVIEARVPGAWVARLGSDTMR